MKKFFPTLLASSVVATATFAVGFSPVHAASMSFNITEFTGNDTAVKFTLDDQAAGAGKIQFKVDYLATGTNTIADISGIFFNINNDSLLTTGLQVNGTGITASQFGPAGSVSQVGSGQNNLNGGGNVKNSFDVGFLIGQEGIGQGKGDYQSITFTLSHTMQALTLDNFAEQSFGARLTSVGSGNNRGGSSKLKGTSPSRRKVPEPSTAIALGLVAIGAARGIKKQKSQFQA